MNCGYLVRAFVKVFLCIYFTFIDSHNEHSCVHYDLGKTSVLLLELKIHM